MMKQAANANNFIETQSKGASFANQTKPLEPTKTIEIEGDTLSQGRGDTTSQGGTRYVVGIKGDLQFYGNKSGADINDSLSQYSRSRGGGPMGNYDDGGSGYDNMSNLNGSIENDGPMPTNQNNFNKGGFDGRENNAHARGMTAGGFSQGNDFDQRSNNSKVSKASKSGHKKKKPKGQRELDEDVS